MYGWGGGRDNSVGAGQDAMLEKEREIDEGGEDWRFEGLAAVAAAAAGEGEGRQLDVPST